MKKIALFVIIAMLFIYSTITVYADFTTIRFNITINCTKNYKDAVLYVDDTVQSTGTNIYKTQPLTASDISDYPVDDYGYLNNIKLSFIGYFVKTTDNYWNFVIDYTVGKYHTVEKTNVYIRNIDMSQAYYKVPESEENLYNTTKNVSFHFYEPDSSIVIPPTVLLNANGGDDSPVSLTSINNSIIIPDNIPTRDGYTFLGWSLSSTATSAQYAPGDSITITSDTTLYAVWQANGSSSGGGNEGEEKSDSPSITKEGTVTSPTAPVSYKLTSNVPDYLGDYLTIGTTINSINSIQTLAKAPGIDNPDRGSYELKIYDNLPAGMTYNNDFVLTVNGKTVSSSLYSIEDMTAADNTPQKCITTDLVKLFDNNYFTYKEIESSPAITVTYTAKITDPNLAGEYQNKAWVNYEDTDSATASYTFTIYKIEIEKVNSQKQTEKLSGAVFTLTGNGVSLTATSDENGIATFTGLLEGSYALTETTPPKGFVGSNDAKTITLPADADNETKTATLKYVNTPIPHTGAYGFFVENLKYIIPGAVIVIVGIVGIVVSINGKKKNNNQN